MANHIQHVKLKHHVREMCDLNKYMFLIEQDVKVLFGELVQETY
jgi:hypothetical protein